MKLTKKHVSAILLATAVAISGCATKKEAPVIEIKKEQPRLTITRDVPQDAKLNTEFTYTLKVVNTSDYKIDDVVVTENLPGNFDLIKVSPPTEERAKVLAWDIGIMIPGQTEVITITGKPTAIGKVNYKGDSVASFNLKPMLVFTEVVAPELALTATGPEEALVGDEIPVKLVVKNTGTSTIENITLPHSFPANMTTIDGEKQININVGSLGVAQSTNIPLNVTANKRGKYINEFTVISKEGVKANAVYAIVMKQPKLDFSANVPAVRYVGNIIPYKLEVQNSGNGNAREMEATLSLPSGMKFVSANEGGEFNNDTITWNFRDFLPNETKTFVAKLVSDDIRMVRATAQVKAKNADAQRVSLTTDVQGIPAISIDLADINDPIALGEVEDYIIKVSNQGSLAAKNVVVTCVLEDTMQYVKVSGPAQVDSSNADPQKIVFKPIASLGVNQEVTLHAYVKAIKSGDTRFTVSITCDQLDRPVTRNESTTFYKE